MAISIPGHAEHAQAPVRAPTQRSAQPSARSFAEILADTPSSKKSGEVASFAERGVLGRIQRALEPEPSRPPLMSAHTATPSAPTAQGPSNIVQTSTASYSSLKGRIHEASASKMLHRAAHVAPLQHKPSPSPAINAPRLARSAAPTPPTPPTEPSPSRRHAPTREAPTLVAFRAHEQHADVRILGVMPTGGEHTRLRNAVARVLAQYGWLNARIDFVTSAAKGVNAHD